VTDKNMNILIIGQIETVYNLDC